MAKQTINLGTAPSGVGGDTPRSAFTKTQANFDELYGKVGELGDPWAFQPLGVPIPVFMHLSGVTIPPLDRSYRYIQLSAGASYNAISLASEVVSGSAPLVSATAIVAVADSPLNGQSIRLINTEQRVLRAGNSSGAVMDDAFQGHLHNRNQEGADEVITKNGSGWADLASGTVRSLAVRAVTGGAVADPNYGAARIANETRAKSINAVYFMRIR